MQREFDMGRKPEWRRYFWIEAGIVSAALTVLDIALYLFNIWDLYGLAQGILLMCRANLLIYAFAQMMADGLVQMMGDVLPFKTVYRKSKILYTLSGAPTEPCSELVWEPQSIGRSTFLNQPPHLNSGSRAFSSSGQAQ